MEKDSTGRFILVNCVLNMVRFTLVNVYGPNHDDPTFFNNLVLKLATAGGQCLVGGDFNLIMQSKDRSSTRPFTRSRAATALDQGMRDLGLCDIWRTRNPDMKDFSYFSRVHGSHSRIDMFLVPLRDVHTVLDCSYLAANLSDHNPVQIILDMGNIQSPSHNWRFKSFMLKDPDFIKFMNGHIDQYLEANSNTSSHGNIWEALKAYMRGQILSYSAHKTKEKRKLLLSLEKEIRNLELDHANTKSEETFNVLASKRVQYDNLCTNKAEAALARTNYHYYEFGNKTSKLLAWQIKKEEASKVIHSISTDDGRSLLEPQEINKEFKTFYSTLYTSDHDTQNYMATRFLGSITLPKLDADDKNILDSDISKNEVLEAIKSLNNNKAPGPDGFPIEYYKTFQDKLLSPLTDMFKEALSNKTLPSSLELATITLLPKPGKDPEKCASYRPLSLLNSDYKILSKLIASRMDNIIPKIIHADQSGFIRNRQGSDNVRRLLHIIESTRSQKTPLLIMSMDAEKAFDRIEPSFLLQTLKEMNFGEKFIQYIETFFNAPRAQILTNGVLSDVFSLSRGVRQGCPISPLLFAIAIEPLAIAIRSDADISGIKIGPVEHKLSLYADDLLVFLTDPSNSLPSLLQCFQHYSAASGYKLNLSKSEAMPINIQNNNIRNLVEPLRWCPNGFKYLGIEIRKSVDKILKDNHLKLLDRTKADFCRWRDLPLSLIGKVNSVKMNILPKFLYLFQCIPVKIPKSFFKELNKSMSGYLWKGKVPRVKLTTLQASYANGGLKLPNFRFYYIAAQFRSIWCWLHSEGNEARWLSIEQQELKNIPLNIIPFLGSRKELLKLTKNPIILNSFNAWHESHSIIGSNISLLRKTPFWKNPRIPYPGSDSTLQKWVDSGIKTVDNLYRNNIITSFQQLSEQFDLLFIWQNVACEVCATPLHAASPGLCMCACECICACVCVSKSPNASQPVTLQQTIACQIFPFNVISDRNCSHSFPFWGK